MSSEVTSNRAESRARIVSRRGFLIFGGSTGTLALLVKERQPEAAVAGLDADPEMLWRAGEKAAAAGVEVELSEGRSDAMPYGDGSFDAVVSTLFFHHLSRPVRDATAHHY